MMMMMMIEFEMLNLDVFSSLNLFLSVNIYY